MKKLRILHTSELRLDTGYEALSAGKAAERRVEQRELLKAIARLAGDEKVDMVLLSGNLLSSACCGRSAELLSEFLNDVPAPVFISPGSLDYYSSRSAYAKLKLPENVYVFTSPEMECIPMPGLGARVWGAAFTDSRGEGLPEDFRAERKEGLFNILCLNAGPDEYVNEEALKSSGMDFAALGGLSEASGLKIAGSCRYSYSGAPEGKSFSECGEKTVSIIDLDEKDCSIRTIPVCSRKYEVLNIDVTGSAPLIAIHSSLPDDTVSDVYRIVLKGECAVSPDLKELYEHLSGLFFELQLIDETRPCRSVWERAGEKSLRGIFLQKLLEKMEASPDAAQRRAAEQAARWGLAALNKEEEAVKHGD